MSTIYVVMAQTMEDEENKSYPVAAYSEKHLANEHAKRATEVSVDLILYSGRVFIPIVERLKKTSPYDPNCTMADDTTTDYDVWNIELDSLPIGEINEPHRLRQRPSL